MDSLREKKSLTINKDGDLLLSPKSESMQKVIGYFRLSGGTIIFEVHPSTFGELYPGWPCQCIIYCFFQQLFVSNRQELNEKIEELEKNGEPRPSPTIHSPEVLNMMPVTKKVSFIRRDKS
jgi:hypothetical protein